MGIRTVNITNDLMQSTTPLVRLLLALAVVGFFTWVAARIMQPRREAFLAVPDGAAPSQDMLNVALGVLLTAYVFIAAFLLASFWSSLSDAKSAATTEQAGIAQMTATLDAVPDVPADLRQAIDDYIRSAKEVESPALRDGDGDTAATAHAEVSRALVEATGRWAAQDQTATAGIVLQSMREAITSGNDRIDSLPNDAMYRVVQLLGAVGIACLALAVILAPASRGPSFIVLSTFVFGMTLLYFLLIEYVNPFLTGGAEAFPRM